MCTWSKSEKKNNINTSKFSNISKKHVIEHRYARPRLLINSKKEEREKRSKK